jgi:hypothetical protein
MDASAGIRMVGTLVTLAALGAAAQAPVPHDVAAPASDVLAGVVRLPDPAASATTTAAALIPVRFETSASGRSVATIAFDVERPGDLTLALLAPSAASWRVLAAPAPDEPRELDESGFRSARTLGFAGELLPGWVIDRRDLRGAPAGPWRLRVETAAPAADERAWLLVSTDPALQATAYVATQRLVAGEEIAIVARIESSRAAEVDRARVEIEGSAGPLVLEMHDDGRHQDREPNDGWFGAFVPGDQAGSVFARVDLGGIAPGESRFQRSVPLAFQIVLPSLELDGSAGARRQGGKLAIEVGASVVGAPRRVHASAEVWGRDDAGAEVPVCWISRIDEPEIRGASARVPLELDLRWLDVARAHAPLELRAVRLQDPDTENVLDALEVVPLDAPRLPPLGPALGPPREISRDMLDGVDREGGAPLGLAWKRSLMLVHGYCSSGSIWPAADFTQPKQEFLDPNANRTHDQFAQLLIQRAQAAQLTSFGIVGHSQGGPAALHLLTYYASGLDLSFGGRRIQSVASPYQGTPLASLGFFACGVNNNMTPSGATTWLAGIPSWARADVFTWTTANSGSACNVFTGILLTDPEDGTVEKTRGELPGGNNMGHVTGWCHTTGMSNPASYTDHARNLSMDGAAAR